MSEDEYDIKTSGTKCSVKEARKFYVEVFLQSQREVLKTVLLAVENFKQPIPVGKILASDLEQIIDDCNYIENKFNAFGEVIRTLYDMYHKPEEYEAWCGKVNDSIIYYVEKKKKVVVDCGGMFV